MKLLLSLTLIAAASAFVVSPAPTHTAKTPLMSSVAPQADFDQVNGKRVEPKPEDTLLNPSFLVTYLVALAAPITAAIYPAADGGLSVLGATAAGFHAVLASLLWIQTSRVRCVFEEDGFEFYNIKGPGLDLNNGAWLEKKPSNFVTESRNRWSYDKIVSYEFFPSADLPLIVYMKETETRSGGNQPHFFPGLFNGQEFKKEMEKHGVKSA